MTIVAIVQARMNSSRFPGKVLQPLGERTLLGQLLDTLSRVDAFDQCIVATTTRAEDMAIVNCAMSAGVEAFRGSEDDVLGRFLGAAKQMKADTIVRLTADCPLLDGDLVRYAGQIFDSQHCDYISLESYPRGIGDVEVVTFEALERAAREACETHQREHVMPFIFEHPDWFSVILQHAPPSLYRPDYRVCVDDESDLVLVREVFRRLGGTGNVQQVVDLLDSQPDLVAINSHVRQRTLQG